MCAKTCTASRKVVVIHATISHRASPPLNNHREGGEACMSKYMNDCVCCVCSCLCDKYRTMEAACDYASLISYSKRESARLPCIMTNFIQTGGECWDVKLVHIPSL